MVENIEFQPSIKETRSEPACRFLNGEIDSETYLQEINNSETLDFTQLAADRQKQLFRNWVEERMDQIRVVIRRLNPYNPTTNIKRT